jgi:hypothetical protein
MCAQTRLQEAQAMGVFDNFFEFGWEANRKQWDGPAIEHGPEYSLSVIEFDDQGWYHDVGQRDALMHFFDETASEDLLIVVFVHGWKHNAAAADGNLRSFRALLRDARASEDQRETSRRVLGVYLSWRGRSLYGNWLWMNASFWTRKGAAFRVAVGSVREILARLRAEQRQRNRQTIDHPNGRRGQGTRLVLTGHSFGALILFSAVAENLIESVARSHERVVRPFGDLVILVNPAFEATRYQPLLTALLARPGFPPDQRPCFLAVTATNDWATGWAFPIGRWLVTRFEAVRRRALPGLPDDAQRQANLKTVGHLPWLRTHRLSAPAQPKAPGTKAEQAYAGSGPPDVDVEKRAFEEFTRKYRPDGHLKPRWQRSYTRGALLEHVTGNPDNPFWIVEVTPEVIDGHNGIFRPVFLDFLRQLCDDRLRHIETPPGGGPVVSS